MKSLRSIALAIAVAVTLIGCNSLSNQAVPKAVTVQPVKPSATGDMLLTFDNSTGNIYSWTITSTGSSSPSVWGAPTTVTGASGMAGSYKSTDLTVNQSSDDNVGCDYVISTGACNPGLTENAAGVDVAARNVGDEASVSVEANGSLDLLPFDRTITHIDTCSRLISSATAVTADSADNIYIQGSGPSFTGIVKVAPGGQHICSEVKGLRPQKGTPGGIRIDRNTGDLYVVDNPNSCLGSSDGRIIDYPVPYSFTTAITHRPSGITCAGLVRLDADGSHLFILDSNGGSPRIDQENTSTWGPIEGYYTGVTSPTAPTTIPNTVPN